MKRRMEQLINGRFEYEAPQITLSADHVEAAVKPGENYRGEFYILTEEHRRIKGFLTSTDRRIVLAKEKFSGDTICVPFGVDVQGLSANESAEGEIIILSDLGEKRIGIRITVEEAGIYAAGKEIRNLEDFADLAREDYREAFRLFNDERFVRLLEGRDRKYLSLYKGMSQNPVTYQHMEEFLIGAGYKEAVSLSLEQPPKAAYKIERSVKDTLSIKKNTWGHVRMEVETIGSFLDVEKRVVTGEDFIGSHYGLEFLVLRGKIGPGRHYGKIRIRTVYQTLEFEVEASLDNGLQQLNASYAKHLQADLAKDYFDLVVHRITYREWEKKTGDNLEQLRETGFAEPAMALIESYYYYAKEETRKAQELLRSMDSRKFEEGEEELFGAYLCLSKLTGLISGSQTEIAGQLRILCRKRVDSYPLLYMLVQEDSHYRDVPAKLLYEMEKRFELGGTSPFMYLEAVRILEKDDGLLCKLSSFSVQVLRFALRHGLLTGAMLRRAAYMTCHEKSYRESLCRFLCEGYEKFPSNDVLEAICRMLMLGNARKKENFRWYALAVEKQLRITRLYEYYIETLDEHGNMLLPQVIRMYFAYNNTLDSSKRAMIYANVIRNKDADRTTYQSYRKNMEQFAAQELVRGKINEDYACIYREFITQMSGNQEAEALARILFTRKITCGKKNMRSVIVCHGSMVREEIYPCVDGVAYVSVYSPDVKIIFEDEKHRRFSATVDYTMERLMPEDELADRCAQLDAKHPGLLLHICGSREEEMQIDSGNLECYRKASKMDEFTPVYRQQICRKLLGYFRAHVQSDTSDRYLRQLDYDFFAHADRVGLVEILVECGLYREAFDLICQYGYERVKTTSLLRLASRMVLDLEFAENEELIHLAYFVFRQGLYDETILEYLRDHYFGTPQEMYGVWERLSGFGLESYGLEEKLLMLMMFSRAYLPKGAQVLKNYILGQGKELVIISALTFEACGYFLGGRVTDKIVFNCMEKLLIHGKELDLVCRLALLKHYSNMGDFTKEQQALMEKLLEDMESKKLRFAFYQQLPAEYQKLYQLEDKIFVEERFPADSKVTIHYRLGRAGEAYKSEPMKNMYQGIFVKEFLLFYGETLTCYMTVEEKGRLYETKERQISMEDVRSGGSSRYQLLNQMLAGYASGSEEKIRKAAEAYLFRKKMAEDVFEMLE